MALLINKHESVLAVAGNFVLTSSCFHGKKGILACVLPVTRHSSLAQKFGTCLQVESGDRLCRIGRLEVP